MRADGTRETGRLAAILAVGFFLAAFALLALFSLRETFHLDLDYVEGDAEPAKQAA